MYRPILGDTCVGDALDNDEELRDSFHGTLVCMVICINILSRSRCQLDPNIEIGRDDCSSKQIGHSSAPTVCRIRSNMI